MSLRTRLTLLYSTLVGGILLLFGVAVYQLISVTLTNQVDDILSSNANTLINSTKVNTEGELYILPSTTMDLPAYLYFQLWERGTVLTDSSLNISGFTEPLDPLGRVSGQPVYRDLDIGNAHLRVLSVPLYIGNRPVGAIQVASSLAVVDATQSNLLTVMIIGVIIAMVVAGIAVSITTYRFLRPIENVTETALQITRADDLSRRIPYSGPSEDEIGQLILAFNQTLERLEYLFHTQRRFVADVGHELRTPLTVIKGNVSLLRRIGSVEDESLDGIESEVDRLTRMVGDLLFLARAESGSMPMEKVPVELDSLLLEVWQQMQVLTHGKIELKLGEFDQVQVMGDRDRLKQVLFNLLGNAIKYTPEGGEVTVGLGKKDNEAFIEVCDTGSGIPAEDLPHIFERFYRTEKSRTRSKDGKGFGLGLSIAYWIVQNHGGRIDVESSENKGSKFTIWLPVDA